MVKISVVVCVYNEEQNVVPLINSISASLENIDYEIIYVDDGSTDHTVEEVLKTAHPRLTLVSLAKNYGQSSALAAGIMQSRGEYIVLIDGDLQNDP